MNSSPKVSVIMPMLNSREYINECLDSVINQTLKDIEILCIDAGSTDGTREILSEYARKDSRIKIIDSDKKSYGYQVNLGFDSAQGEYIAIVESDDYIADDMYEILYDIAKRNNLEAIKCDTCSFKDTDGSKGKRTFTRMFLLDDPKYYNRIMNPKEEIYLFKAFMHNTPGIYQLSFIRVNNIRLNETPGAAFQDNGLWFQIFMYCQRMYFYPKALYMLRRDNPNSSIYSSRTVFSMCDEYDYVYDIISKNNKLRSDYPPICALCRFYSYRWNLERIDNKYKYDFLMRFSKDFKKIAEKNELRQSLFNQYEWEYLQQIIKDPERHYAKYMRDIPLEINKDNNENKEDIDDLISKIRILTYIVDETQFDIDNKIHELNCVYSSKSFKIGRIITCLPRKLRDFINIDKEHD